MQKYGIILATGAIMLAIVLSSGCVSGPSIHPACPNCTVVLTPPPLGAAADLHEKGFDAYINGNYSSALDYYNKSLVADPNYTRAWIDKGNVLVSMNRSAEAVLAYDSALALENDLAQVWNKRGAALMATGNFTAARDSFNRALQLAPNYVEAQENLNLTLAKLK
jgi:tetratricopeptide (TPR) repeat protein